MSYSILVIFLLYTVHLNYIHSCFPIFSQKTQHRYSIESDVFFTSNNIAQCFWRRIRSPLAKVSSLLSSMTEFMFSTHNASTSPSYTMYFRSFLSVGLLISLKMLERRPSVQSLVIGSRIPYSSITLRSLGFIVYSLVCSPSLKYMSHWLVRILYPVLNNKNWQHSNECMCRLPNIAMCDQE